MRLAADRYRRLSRQIAAQAAEFSITPFLRQNPALIKSSTYAPEIAKIGPALFKFSQGEIDIPTAEFSILRGEISA
jgi:hypothetical protein